MDNFEGMQLKEEILKAIGEMGFEKPTPIQSECIPHLLSSDQSLIALAQTGTGKTAAFGLPVVNLVDLKSMRPQALILSPTRELCLQITKDLKSYTKYLKGCHIVPVYGGSSIQTQIRELNRGAQVIVATPGRAVDLIKRKRMKLGEVRHVVLDEADEMLTMGFKEDLNLILGETPEDKLTLLFSATMSKDIRKIAKKYMDDPKEIAVARENQGADNVEHINFEVSNRDKYETLKRIADMNPDIYGIVFCRTRRETNEVATRLMQDDYSADVLNGDLSQQQRDKVMKSFRKKNIQILVATDVAARGLDVNDLTHIINYNIPDDIEVYTHRSGRTGRAGKSGISIMIASSRDRRRMQEIEKKSGVKFSKAVVPSGEEVCKKQLLALIERVKNVEVDEQQIGPFLEDIYTTLEGLDRETLIQHFVSLEFNKFLAYYKNARDLNEADRGGRGRDKLSKRQKMRKEYSKLFIDMGSKANLTPQLLMGVLNDAVDSQEVAIGKIDILKKFTFFEVEKEMANLVIESLHGGDIDGNKVSVELSAENSDMGTSFKFKSGKGKKKSNSKGKDGRGRRGGPSGGRGKDKEKRGKGRKKKY